MVLGHPVAVVAELLGPPGQVDGVAQRGTGVAAAERIGARSRIGQGYGAWGPRTGQTGAAAVAGGRKGRLGISRRSTGATSAWNSSRLSPVLLVGQPVGVGLQVHDLVAEPLVVAVHLVDDLLRAADQDRAALDRVLQGGEDRLDADAG